MSTPYVKREKRKHKANPMSREAKARSKRRDRTDHLKSFMIDHLPRYMRQDAFERAMK